MQGSALTAAFIGATLLVMAEPRAVFGPDGPRLVRASDAETPPIVRG